MNALAQSDEELGADAFFRARLREGRLVMQRCDDCQAPIFYPREACPCCGGTQLAWVDCDGRGSIYSTSVVRRPADKGGDYNIAIIELSGGHRFMSQVQGMAPDQVRIGMPIKASVAEIGGEHAIIVEPAEEARL